MLAKSAARAVLASLVFLACACSDHPITLRNETGAGLTYCPVETDPPPPHRVVSSRVQATMTTAPIDVDDFNPVYWDNVSSKGFIVQLALEDDPQTILVRTYLYKAPPGSEGNDPAMQPMLLADYPYEVVPALGEHVRIHAGAIDQDIPISFSQD